MGRVLSKILLSKFNDSVSGNLDITHKVYSGTSQHSETLFCRIRFVDATIFFRTLKHT